MGLRFRKSISIMPGVKLNFGKTGMSVSAGVPGLRKTFHTSGRVTTSIGIPGTGISYVTSENKNKQQNKNNVQNSELNQYSDIASNIEDFEHNNFKEQNFVQNAQPISSETVADIHRVSDEIIDWTEVLVNENPPDDSYNKQFWVYCHNIASNILSGDINTYLEVINDINPLADLLAYGGSFEFGTDSPLKMEVEFQIKLSNLIVDKTSEIYQDYVCSVAIRIARDMFALLPIQNVVVHTDDVGKTILSVCFDRKTMNSLKFNFIDPSNVIGKFKFNMKFNGIDGFVEVDRLDI